VFSILHINFLQKNIEKRLLQVILIILIIMIFEKVYLNLVKEGLKGVIQRLYDGMCFIFESLREWVNPSCFVHVVNQILYGLSGGSWF
jgi:hypothetical protein